MDDKIKVVSKNIIDEIIDIVDMEDISYMDAIIHIAEKYNFEIEFVGEVVKKNEKLAAAVRSEAEKLNYIKKIDRIEI